MLEDDQRSLGALEAVAAILYCRMQMLFDIDLFLTIRPPLQSTCMY
jgi:hypothetical protein